MHLQQQAASSSSSSRAAAWPLRPLGRRPSSLLLHRRRRDEAPISRSRAVATDERQGSATTPSNNNATTTENTWQTERISNTSGSRAAASRALLKLLGVEATPDANALALAAADLSAPQPPFPALRLPFSNVVAQKKRAYFFGRPWVERDLGYATFFVPLHALFFVFAPFTATPEALECCVVGFILTGWLGIGLGYHRLFAHRSFRAHPVVERTLALLGACAFEGDVGEWAKMHLSHHVCSDKEGDRHSPRDGFWHSHMGWIFDSALSNARGLDAAGKEAAAAAAGALSSSSSGGLEEVGLLAEEAPTSAVQSAVPWFVKSDPAFYGWLRSSYMPLQGGQLAFFVALALALRDPGILVWGYAGRLIITFHATWLVNSAAHVWGDQNFESDDGSRDNWLIALLVGGDGWHNGHHAFPRSARHGLAAPEWADFNWQVVRALEKAGLAWDVQLPSAEVVERKRKKTTSAV
jgi:stearoyl-CoA desaturase (delta-9 desaturase)